MKRVVLALAGVMFYDRSSIKFAIGVLIGLAFSMSVILSTIGIMDGFDISLKQGLKKSVGDAIVYSKSGFFVFSNNVSDSFKNINVRDSSPLIQTEAFIITNESSQGVLVKGIEYKSFSKVTGLKLKVSQGEIVIGKELANKLRLKVGDEIVLGLANGNEEFSGLPLLKRYKISGLVTHGIYKKDLRIVYISLPELQKSLKVGKKINLVSLNFSLDNISLQNAVDEYTDKVQFFVKSLERGLGYKYKARPFWNEFAGVIESVQIQKTMIGLILQLVVVIAIFNVLAFIIFINEKKSKELFLFKALGMSRTNLAKAWNWMIFYVWLGSCFISILFVKFFNFCLGNLSFLKLPGDVYHFGRLSIILDYSDYILVFGLTLCWLMIMVWIVLFRVNRGPILEGLRKEFA